MMVKKVTVSSVGDLLWIKLNENLYNKIFMKKSKKNHFFFFIVSILFFIFCIEVVGTVPFYWNILTAIYNYMMASS